MTDDQMDARLRAAGLAFRDGEDNVDAVAHLSPEFDLTVAVRPSRRRLPLLPLSAAAVAVVLVIGTVLAAGGFGGGHQQPAAGPAYSKQLVDRTWRFSAVEYATADGGVSGRSASSGITLRFDRHGGVRLVLRQTVDQGRVHVQGHRLVFSDLSTVGTRHGDASNNNAVQFGIDKPLVEGFLSGSLTWTTHGGQLRLTQGIHSLVFDAPPLDRPSAPDAAGPSASSGN